MPLNYSKWDTLEVSDDSDIEGHPNVDHKSLVRWKQRDIHEKRYMRNLKIAQLEADIACNQVLLPRLKQIVKDIKEGGEAKFKQIVERLKVAPSPDKPPNTPDDSPSYDAMIGTLLLNVWDEMKKDGVTPQDPNLGEKLVEAVQVHVEGLTEDIAKKKKELEEENVERQKKITSEDIHEGYSSKYVPPKPDPKPLVKPKEKKPPAKKEIVEFETLNPTSLTSAPPTASASTSSQPPTAPAPAPAPAAAAPTPAVAEEEDDDEDDIPSLTPVLRSFSQLPLSSSDPTAIFSKSFEFIQSHPDVIVDGAVDALLLEAFTVQLKAGSDGKDKKLSKYAYQCVHQGLLVQYCEKIGRDGVRMFFRKMIEGNKVAIQVFEDDVKKTYQHIISRVKYHEEKGTTGDFNKNAQKETIQLVSEGGDGSTIEFFIPSGPPPTSADQLPPNPDGIDTTDMDPEDILNALKLRWAVFQSFSPAMQEALKAGSLEKVNEVLGDMEVQEAEELVGNLQMSGMLNFSEGGVRDLTGADEGGEAEAEGES